MDRKVIPLNAAFVEAHTTLGEANQVVFGFLQLEAVDIKLLVDVPGIKEERVSRNGEQRFRQLPDALDVECVPPLRCRKAYAG